MFLTIVAFILVLGLLVVVHEWGHFATARKFGVKVDEFGMGLPPRIFGFYKDEAGKWKPVGLKSKEAPNTIWSLNWIPLGGFVKIKGEEGGDNNDPTSFVSKTVWQRILVISAGVSMNIALAAVLLSIGLGIGSPQIVESESQFPYAVVENKQIRVTEVLAGSPADQAGLQVPDTVLAIDGDQIASIEEMQGVLADKVGEKVIVRIDRAGEEITVNMVPEILAETNAPGIGVALVQTGFVRYPWYLAPVFGVWETIKTIGLILFGFFTVIVGLFTGGEFQGQVYGPVGIANLVGDAARLGFLYVMQFTAILSIIIAVINFLPFPALDGGRVVFLIIEGLRGKPVNQKFENLMHNIGFALLMILILVVTYNDIARVSGGIFLDWSNKLFG